MRAVLLALLATVLGVPHASAQETPACRFLCTPESRLNPPSRSQTCSARRGSSRTASRPVRRERTEFELILSLGLPTRVSWLEFTVEAIVLPFDRESTPELEFETNFTWLPPARTGGWVSSHVDIVDKFSPSERPADSAAYTHKLNLELDTSLAVFKWLRDHWLRGVELEGSLDYVATGLAKAGDRVGGVTYLTRASPWSFSIVFVFPLAPL